MPIPFPVNPPDAAPPPAATPAAPQSWLGRAENWAERQVRDSHVEAMNLMGEYALFTLMWHAKDFAAGLVAVCPTCTMTGTVLDRASKAYQQPTRELCPDCFGTHFEGGFRAQIIRPCLWTDHNTDTRNTPRGEVSTDSMVVETTEDFEFRSGDYIFRANGDRYQGQELSGAWIRTGFSVPDFERSVAGQISQAKLEDPASVAFIIPPTADRLDQVLTVPVNTHFPLDFSANEVIRGPLLP
jgi:hypothetical protein